MSLTETTITIAAVVFIVILIILAKLSSQMDKMSNIQKQIIRKLIEDQESSKWTTEMIKDKFDKILSRIIKIEDNPKP